MKDLSLLFMDDMVRAILSGAKTETRRIPGLQRLNESSHKDEIGKVALHDGKWFFWRRNARLEDFPLVVVPDQYGPAGRAAYVKECFWRDKTHPDPDSTIIYRSDGWPAEKKIDRWVSSIFMPARLARIRLTILDVWPQRIMEMTEDNAREEGVENLAEFYKLWDSINVDYRVRLNPWVFRIKFKRA